MDILSSSGNTGSKKRKNVNNSSYPRYVRVNTLKSTFVNALLKLKAEGYVQVWKSTILFKVFFCK